MDSIFTRYECDNLQYYTIPAFEQTGLVVHAFSTRVGGVSQGTYESLNMGLFTKDSPENVLANRQLLTRMLGIEMENLVGAHQVHLDHVYRVEEKDKGRGAWDAKEAIENTDALMTKEKGVALFALFADCVPVFFLDPVNQAIALTHAGWKGTVAKIAAKTVKTLTEHYGTRPEQLLAAIGPSIGPCHYQVDQPVIEQVKQAFPNRWEELLKNWTHTGCAGDAHANLDLWRANRIQLEEVGLLSGNITTAGLCTYCHSDLFFSHRRGMAGRQAGVIMLK